MHACMQVLSISSTEYITPQINLCIMPAYVTKGKVVIYGEGKVRETGRKEEEKNNGGDRMMNEEERGNCYFCWYAFNRGRGDYVD